MKLSANQKAALRVMVSYERVDSVDTVDTIDTPTIFIVYGLTLKLFVLMNVSWPGTDKTILQPGVEIMVHCVPTSILPILSHPPTHQPTVSQASPDTHFT